MLARGEAEPEQFLLALASPRREPLAQRTVVVVAHPDDETIGCGAQLSRFSDVTIVHVTDGAPQNFADARARGFETAEAYAAARRAELKAAVSLAGIAPDRLVALGWPDQQAGFHLAEIAGQLCDALRSAEVVLTHAYEGGHPDHDAVAFAAHAAGELLRRRRGGGPRIVEMPLYHAGPDGLVTQRFVHDPQYPEVELRLSPAEQDIKRRMLAAHWSQRDVVRHFQTEVERFRAAPTPDFRTLPNRGRLNYELHEWGMTGARWLDLAESASRELGLEGVG